MQIQRCRRVLLCYEGSVSALTTDSVLDESRSIFAKAPPRRPAAKFLPTNRAEMKALGWNQCDVIIVTGDAYVDHPSFGMAIIGRLLEAQGFRVGIIAQPAWDDSEAFAALGRPRLFFGVTAGNMDSMVNRYTSDHKVRNDDAYTPGGKGGARPDRSVLVYANRCRQAFKGVSIVIGGIESSLRRLAHYDYWSNKVRRSILFDAKADLLMYGNAERALVELCHRLEAGERIHEIHDIRGTAFARRSMPEEFGVIDSTQVDNPGHVQEPGSPYASCEPSSPTPAVVTLRKKSRVPRHLQAIRLPSFEQVRSDNVLYAHASRVLHLEANPGNARALVQEHDKRLLWINPPPIPLSSADMDGVYELPYARVPHPRYKQPIPAYTMIKDSVTIMRGCFGGCTFCSITEHEGRIIQSRSQKSILRELELMQKSPDFKGVVSDLGGPTANMYRLGCRTREIEAACRKPSCVYPGICSNLKTDHTSLINLYRKARKVPGIKKVLIASGLRYDLAVESPEYVRELVSHHVGGYLKIAPEHTESGPLSKMMKPGIGSYDRFSRLFKKYSREAGKTQYLIPYFIAAHPGTTTEDMVELALWLKRNDFRLDQVQTYLPAPMATATTMYHTEKNPLKSLRANESVEVPKGQTLRTLHKALLRYHAPENWSLVRDALIDLGRDDLIGAGPNALIPPYQPQRSLKGPRHHARTQHTGLPRQRPTKKRGNKSGRPGPRNKKKTKA
jgi:uncharacterized radical SAM protein YgiQ